MSEETKSTEKWECNNCGLLMQPTIMGKICPACDFVNLNKAAFDLQTEYAQLTAENQALREDKQTLIGQILDHQTELQALRKERDNLLSQISDAANKITELKKECEGLRENVGMEVQQLRAQLAKAQEAMEWVKKYGEEVIFALMNQYHFKAEPINELRAIIGKEKQ